VDQNVGHGEKRIEAAHLNRVQALLQEIEDTHPIRPAIADVAGLSYGDIVN
jgi:hypothetical protein